NEVMILLVISSLARIFTSVPGDLIVHTGQAAWLSVFLGLGVAFLQLWLIWQILKNHPGQNLIEATENIAGAGFGTFFNVLWLALIMSVNVLYVRIFSEDLLLSTLFSTPLLVILVIFVISSVWAVFLGIGALARGAKLLAPFILGGMLFLVLCLFPLFNFNNLFPLLGEGLDKIVLWGALEGSVVIEVILGAVMLKSLAKPEILPKAAIRALFIGFGVFTILEIALLLAIHWRSSAEFILPFYSLSRQIHLGRFFQRVESLFLIIWLFIVLIKSAFLLYCSVLTWADTLKLPDYRPLIAPVALVTLMFSLCPSDFSTTMQYSADYMRRYFWILGFGIPIVLVIWDKLKQRSRLQ
ncbi:MAG: endospore germination permease, partial [Clostridia bacterium]|nr:endospore germination permease [Clostridia bacterium]